MNAIIMWNTRYIERVLAQLEQMGLDIQPKDVEGVWIGRFAEVGEQLRQASANSCVAFHLTGPPPFDGVVDELLFTSEPSTESWSCSGMGKPASSPGR